MYSRAQYPLHEYEENVRVDVFSKKRNSKKISNSNGFSGVWVTWNQNGRL